MKLNSLASSRQTSTFSTLSKIVPLTSNLTPLQDSPSLAFSFFRLFEVPKEPQDPEIVEIGASEVDGSMEVLLVVMESLKMANFPAGLELEEEEEGIVFLSR